MIGFIVYFSVVIPDKERVVTIKEKTIEVVNYKRGLELNNEIKRNENKHKIIKLLAKKTDSDKIAKIILNNSLEYNIPVAFAFALAWSESRFKPNAINGIHNSNGSADWGLFQLNDYHRDWSREELLNPYKNTKEAMRVLDKILSNNSQVIAIGIYNVGATGIKKGLPYTTLVHINNVIEYRDNLLDEINEVMVE